MASASSWASSFRSHCEGAVSPCGEPDCSFKRRLWRRFRWRHGTIRLHGSVYCAPACFESAARQYFARLCATVLSAPPVRHRVPLGLLMISRGQLTNPQLRSALEAQRVDGRHRLGEWLEKLGFATEQQVTAALARQWACPVLTPTANCDPACARLLPYCLLESSRMLPVQFVASTRTFHLAFCDGIDYVALYAIERMLDCRTQPCLATRSAVAQTLQQLGHERRPGDRLFDGWREPSDLARITCGYVLKLGADDIRLVGCGSFIWARLSKGKDVANLLFHRPRNISSAETLGFDLPSIPSIPFAGTG
jgi:hypothetical protein